MLVRGKHLPTKLDYTNHTFTSAVVAIPDDIPIPIFPWSDVLDMLLGTILIHQPDSLPNQTFLIVKYTEPSPANTPTTGILIVPATRAHPAYTTVGTWTINHNPDHTINGWTVAIDPTTGIPLQAAVTTYDPYGGKLNHRPQPNTDADSGVGAVAVGLDAGLDAGFPANPTATVAAA